MDKKEIDHSGCLALYSFNIFDSWSCLVASNVQNIKDKVVQARGCPRAWTKDKDKMSNLINFFYIFFNH